MRETECVQCFPNLRKWKTGLHDFRAYFKRLAKMGTKIALQPSQIQRGIHALVNVDVTGCEDGVVQFGKRFRVCKHNYLCTPLTG